MTKEQLVRILYLTGASLSFLAGLSFLSVRFGLIQRYDFQNFLTSVGGRAVLYSLATVSILVGVHFTVRLLLHYREAQAFVREGDLGDVKISPVAVRELARALLQQFSGLHSYKVSLSHAGNGIAIRVRASVNPDSAIGELGEEIQEHLRKNIHQQTDLNVERIDFKAEGVLSRREATDYSEQEEGDQPASQQSASVNSDKQSHEEGVNYG